jgi:C4-dicarboxylate-specific signal transduction histidine kinase
VADLGTVLDEVRIVVEPSLSEEGIGVVWEVGDSLPLVQADHHSLLQVFVNLARNSRQALEEAPVKQVRISTSVENDVVVVRFRDTGPGVPRPEDLFRPFQAGAHSFGLGLYISRAILRSYGGALKYEPEEGGSCFTVELWPMEEAQER